MRITTWKQGILPKDHMKWLISFWLHYPFPYYSHLTKPSILSILDARTYLTICVAEIKGSPYKAAIAEGEGHVKQDLLGGSGKINSDEKKSCDSSL